MPPTLLHLAEVTMEVSISRRHVGDCSTLGHSNNARRQDQNAVALVHHYCTPTTRPPPTLIIIIHSFRLVCKFNSW